MTTYEQAREDHEYLWNTYGPADDMTGGYVDSNDLWRLLRNPNKSTARDCYITQIDYWFQKGPDSAMPAPDGLPADYAKDDPTIQDIIERHAPPLLFWES